MKKKLTGGLPDTFINIYNVRIYSILPAASGAHMRVYRDLTFILSNVRHIFLILYCEDVHTYAMTAPQGTHFHSMIYFTKTMHALNGLLQLASYIYNIYYSLKCLYILLYV